MNSSSEQLIRSMIRSSFSVISDIIVIINPFIEIVTSGASNSLSIFRISSPSWLQNITAFGCSTANTAAVLLSKVHISVATRYDL